ncbi:uncharacterized protein [Macrobrachium rosenbergii]|uniref:uncharacterized protein n=1 Tax=Macrobrachium rosenbergii TaxID=79674 RepID=UPI0034D72F6A
MTPPSPFYPPPNVSLTHAQAAKSVNGAPPMVVGCSTDLSKPFPLEGPSWCRYKADDDLNDLKPQQLSIMPPPPSTPASPPPPPVRRTYLEERVSDDKVTHGCLRLPLVQVFSDDNMLVATNKFSTPSELPSSSSFRLQPATSSFRSNSPSSHALAPPPQLQEPHPTAPGSLYVERIPAHCKSDSGVLYVPPVDERRLRRSKQDEPPAKGNSRRTRAKVNDVASPSPPPPPPPPATSVTWTPPERVPPRSSSSKAAARALLSEVLSPRIENQLQHRPPSPRPQRLPQPRYL